MDEVTITLLGLASVDSVQRALFVKRYKGLLFQEYFEYSQIVTDSDEITSNCSAVAIKGYCQGEGEGDGDSNGDGDGDGDGDSEVTCAEERADVIKDFEEEFEKDILQ